MVFNKLTFDITQLEKTLLELLPNRPLRLKRYKEELNPEMLYGDIPYSKEDSVDAETLTSKVYGILHNHLTEAGYIHKKEVSIGRIYTHFSHSPKSIIGVTVTSSNSRLRFNVSDLNRAKMETEIRYTR